MNDLVNRVIGLVQSDDGNGQPVIASPITLEGQGSTIMRAGNATPFRIFAVNGTEI